MLIGNQYIKRALDSGCWTAHRDDQPVGSQDLKIGPHSIDVTLGGVFLMSPISGNRLVDPYAPPDWFVHQRVVTDEIVVSPGQFLLGCTRERFDSSNWLKVALATRKQYQGDRDLEVELYCTQMYDGRSTMGRLGIMSHVTAGYGDLGFSGNFTLEIYNVSPNRLILRKGMRIGQVSFHGVATANTPVFYSGGYTDQHKCEPVAPALGRDRFVVEES